MECFEGRVWLKFLLSIIRFFKKSPRHPDTSKVTATIIIQSHQLYSIVLRWNSNFLYLKIVGKLREFFLCKPKQTRSMASSIKISKSFNENVWICAVCLSEFFPKSFLFELGTICEFWGSKFPSIHFIPIPLWIFSSNFARLNPSFSKHN